MNSNLSILFGAAFVGGFVVWLFGVVETIAWWRLSSWSYRTGILWIRRSITTCQPPPSFDRIEIGTPPSALRCRRLDDGTLVFRSHIPMADLFARRDRYSVLPFKACLSWKDGVAQLEVRLPLASIAFALFWLAGWTVGAMRIAQSNPSVGIGLWFGGLAILTGMFWWSFVAESTRVQSAFDALASHFGWPQVRIRN